MRTKGRKGMVFEVKDAEKGTFSAVFATFNVKDHHGDWTLPGAFKEGQKVAISPFGHSSALRGVPPVGTATIRIEKERAILDGQFNLNMATGRDTFEAVKQMGEICEWSYGYEVLATGEVTEELRQKGVSRVLKSVDVFEGSPVLRGAGVNTETLDVKERGEDEDESTEGASTELVQFMRTRQRLAGV